MADFRKFRRVNIAERPVKKREDGKIGVLIAIPSDEGNIRWSIGKMVAEAVRANGDPACPWYFSYTFLSGCKPIDFARNQIADFFLKNTEDEWLIMVDADQEVPDNWPMLLRVDGADVVSGTTYCWVPNDYKEGRLRVNQYGLNEKYQCFNITPPNTNGQPYRIPAVGTGCLAIKREVFAKIARPYFKFEFYPDTGRIMRGEDIHFSMRCLEKGLVVVAHPGVQFGHVKTVDLAKVGEYAEAWRKFANSGSQHPVDMVLSI